MTIKAEAIIYAEELEEYGEFQTYFDGVAAELRRQHDEIKRLHEVNKELLETLKGLQEIVKAATASGDWVVDGSCDPDALMLHAEAVTTKASGSAT